ncbi:MAG: glycosyltransferase family 2 protein, partial [Chloroflexota bacterium]
MSNLLTPFVSIIIPIRNEGRNLTPCLENIAQQDYPPHYVEIIVVDAASTDDSCQKVLEFATDHTYPAIQLIQEVRHNIATGLNFGIRAAQGDVVIRTDARTRLSKDYISTCVSYLQAGKADNVGGLMRPVGTNYVSKAYALAAMSPFSAGDAKFRYSTKEQYVDTVYLGAFWRKLFDEIGFYDERLGSEDFDLNYRLRRAGKKILLSPSIKSSYIPRDSLSALWRQYWVYGRARAYSLVRHPDSLRWRQLVAPLLILSLFGTLLLSLVVPLAIWLFI